MQFKWKNTGGKRKEAVVRVQDLLSGIVVFFFSRENITAPLQRRRVESDACAATFIRAEYSSALGTCNDVAGASSPTHRCIQSCRRREVTPPLSHLTFKKNAQSPNRHNTHTHTLSLSVSHTHSHTHTHLAHNVMVFQVSSLSLCWVGWGRGSGRLTHSEAACRVETQLWLLPWRSKSSGPVRLQSWRFQHRQAQLLANTDRSTETVRRKSVC